MKITFASLADIPLPMIAAHMSDPLVARHLPLWTGPWDQAQAAQFVALKQATWARDGLGHWAFLGDGAYVGWGGFQKEGDDWDFGLVLTAQAFGLGPRITRQALAYARAAPMIDSVTFLLPPSRRHLRALDRMGACPEGTQNVDGAHFLKFRLPTSEPYETRPESYV